MKKYKTNWIEPDGTIHPLAQGESDNLQHECFNEVCKAIFLYSNIFKCKHDKIMDNIVRGKNPNKEVWIAQLGEEVIITIEG